MSETAEDLPAAATIALVRDGDEGLEVLLLERPDHGSFARAWVFPGGRVDDNDTGATMPDRAHSAALRETLEETGLAVSPERVSPLSVWIPPQETSRRFHTWFFLARAPEGAVTINPDESVGYRWLRPADALSLHSEKALTLFPPTFVTLHDLGQHHRVDDAIAWAQQRGVPTYHTVHDPVEQRFLWQGDEVYEGGTETEQGPRHRLEGSERPWRYIRR